jgi:hypothetical protein
MILGIKLEVGLGWVKEEYQSYKCDIHRLYKNYYMNENIL